MECLETSILGTPRRWLPVPHSPAKVYKFRTSTNRRHCASVSALVSPCTGPCSDWSEIPADGAALGLVYRRPLAIAALSETPPMRRCRSAAARSALSKFLLFMPSASTGWFCKNIPAAVLLKKKLFLQLAAFLTRCAGVLEKSGLRPPRPVGQWQGRVWPGWDRAGLVAISPKSRVCIPPNVFCLYFDVF